MGKLQVLWEVVKFLFRYKGQVSVFTTEEYMISVAFFDRMETPAFFCVDDPRNDKRIFRRRIEGDTWGWYLKRDNGTHMFICQSFSEDYEADVKHIESDPARLEALPKR